MDAAPLTARTVKDADALRRDLEPCAGRVTPLVDQELEEGLRSLALPIRGGGGRAVAALNVSVHSSRASMTVLRREFLPAARRTVDAIESDLRGAGGGAQVVSPRS